MTELEDLQQAARQVVQSCEEAVRRYYASNAAGVLQRYGIATDYVSHVCHCVPETACSIVGFVPASQVEVACWLTSDRGGSIDYVPTHSPTGAVASQIGAALEEWFNHGGGDHRLFSSRHLEDATSTDPLVRHIRRLLRAFWPDLDFAQLSLLVVRVRPELPLALGQRERELIRGALEGFLLLGNSTASMSSRKARPLVTAVVDGTRQFVDLIPLLPWADQQTLLGMILRLSRSLSSLRLEEPAMSSSTEEEPLFDRVTVPDLPRWLRIAAVQIDVPLGTHLLQEFEEHHDYGLYNYWTDEGVSSQSEKVMTVLEQLWLREAPHLVVFPELSMPLSVAESMRGFVEGKPLIVVAGTHYMVEESSGAGTSRRNHQQCPVILPTGEIVYSRKRYRSKFEDAVEAKARCDPGRPICVLATGHGDIGFLICKDFLHFADIFAAGQYPYDAKIALAVCPMCTPTVMDHYGKARELAVNSTFTVLCNAVGGHAIGGSGFFGAVDRQYLPPRWRANPYSKIHGLSEFTDHEMDKGEYVFLGSIDLRHPIAATIPTERSRLDFANFRDPVVIPVSDLVSG